MALALLQRLLLCEVFMEVIQFVLNTLDTIKVSGKDDLQKLLGCILALESLIKEDTEEKETENNG